MPRPRLNSRQKKWLSKFLSEYPWFKLREVHEGLSGDRYLLLDGIERLPLPLVPELSNANPGDRYLLLDGIERLPLPLVPELSNANPGYRIHTLRVQLRVYGDARRTAIHLYETIYPHCNIDEKHSTNQQFGQLSLSIPAAVLEVPPAINPVIVTWIPKQKVKPKQGVQLRLPVTELEAKVFGLRLALRPHLPPVSTQELLAEKVTTWSQRDQKEVELPQVMVDLLLAQSADDLEWQSAIDLFGVVGLPGAMSYIEGIPYLRKCFGLPISTAHVSAAVPASIVTKATTVTVKVFG